MKFAFHKLGSGAVLHAGPQDARRVAIARQTGAPNVLNEERKP